MSEFSPENISTFLKRRIDSFKSEPAIYNYGTVSHIGDGVVGISSLPGRCYGEILEFDSGVFAIALDLEENGVGAVLLDTSDTVHVGDRVRGTGRVCEVPVGYQMLGRVIDSIGRPLDGAVLESKEYLPSERPAPKLIMRRPIDKPLETGIISIDGMIPVGRGQRELIIGDRQTGKTTIAIAAILNQKHNDIICVYCAIGQKASTISQVVNTLRKNDALSYTVVVASTASDSPAMQYLTPYSACSVAEYYMERGRDVLIVYDDLTKHAVSYRTMSLLLHRSPGREAYPGDIFYLHSRLLERAACLSKECGGGTMTALPIIETTGGNISSYIPTNVISITDGQIYLETELFHNGIRPAVNTGLSVSRVGRAAQPKAMRKVSASLRIELAQYREMAVFARFGSDLDPSTKALLDHGEKLTVLFTQGKDKCYSLSQKVALLLAFRNDIFAQTNVSDLHSTLDKLLTELYIRCPNEMKNIDTTDNLSDDVSAALVLAMKEIKETF